MKNMIHLYPHVCEADKACSGNGSVVNKDVDRVRIGVGVHVGVVGAGNLGSAPAGL